MEESKFKHTKNGFAHCENCDKVTSHTKQPDIKGNVTKIKVRCDICWTNKYIKRGVK